MLRWTRALIILAFAVGCRLNHCDCPMVVCPEYPVQTLQIAQPIIPYTPSPSPAPDSRPVYEQRAVQVSENATFYPGTIQADEIKLYGVMGVNPGRLLEALKLAIQRTGQAISEEEPVTVRKDEITIQLVPKEETDYVRRHVILARISAAKNQIGLQVSTQEYRIVDGRRIYYRPPEAVPRTYFEALKRELGTP